MCSADIKTRKRAPQKSISDAIRFSAREEVRFVTRATKIRKKNQNNEQIAKKNTQLTSTVSDHLHYIGKILFRELERAIKNHFEIPIGNQASTGAY